MNGNTLNSNDVVEGTKKKEDVTAGTEASSPKQTDLYGSYSPREEVVNATCMDCPVIQIGDGLIYVGKSTLQDIVDLGCDFYHDGTPHDPKRNESEWEIKSTNPNGIILVYLENIVEIQLMFHDNDRTGIHMDDVITSLDIFFDSQELGGNIGISNETAIPDLHSIYLPGGVGFTQTFNLTERFGTTYFEKEYAEPIMYHCREFENFKETQRGTPEKPRYFFRYDTRDEKIYQCMFNTITW